MEIHPAGKKEKSDYTSVDTKVLKINSLNSLEAQMHMFNSDYCCFIILKFALGIPPSQTNKQAAIAQITNNNNKNCWLSPLNH